MVQGYAPEVAWTQLAEACVAIRAGAWWVATNADRTLPSPRGPLPGNGSLVAALATALDRQPDAIVGKPAPDAVPRGGRAGRAPRPLVVGDRLDTDIEGAVRAGMDSLLVLTGVTAPADVLDGTGRRRGRPGSRADLRGLRDAGAAARVPVLAPDAPKTASGRLARAATRTPAWSWTATVPRSPRSPRWRRWPGHVAEPRPEITAASAAAGDRTARRCVSDSVPWSAPVRAACGA